MFKTLVESGAVRTRSARGAALSVMLHGAVIAFAVSVSLPNRMNATPEPKPKSVVYVAAPSTARPPATPRPPSVQRVPTSAPTLPAIVVLTFTPPFASWWTHSAARNSMAASSRRRRTLSLTTP